MDMTPQEVVDVAQKKGLPLDQQSSSITWLNRHKNLPTEKFWQEFAAWTNNLKTSEQVWVLQNMQKEVPDAAIDKLIEAACKTSQGTDHLLKHALGWSEHRQHLYFRGFIKLYAEDPLRRLSQLFFIAEEHKA